MTQRGVERYGDGVLGGSVWSVGKLVGVQSGRQKSPDVLTYKSLKALHDYRRKCNRSVVVWAVHC